MHTVIHQSKNYGLIFTVLFCVWFLSYHYGTTFFVHVGQTPLEGEVLFVLFDVIVVFLLGFMVAELARPTVIPSFVLAIFFGLAARQILMPIIEHEQILVTLVTIGGMLILFGGGLDTPFSRFRELLWPSLTIGILGSVLMAFLTSLVFYPLTHVIGTPLTIGGATVLGAALASTDPASIIPSLRSLMFTNSRPKHIAVIESAITDVTGIVLTGVFLVVMSSGVTFGSITEAYGSLLGGKTLIYILRVIVVGTLAGVAGFAVLAAWSKWKERRQNAGESDPAMFLAVPFAAYGFAVMFGGSGYLATFLVGLLFQFRSHFQHIEHYFNHTIEGFFKPMIFMLLGALVNPADLIAYAPVGVAAFAAFLLLRPLVVFVSLLPYRFTRGRMSFSEFAFLSIVRETGVIPAILLMNIGVSGIEGSDRIAAIGLWVILLSLILLPPITPAVARALGLAKDTPPIDQRPIQGPVAVLCSRGYSFLDRLGTVAQWASDRALERIVLLHCPEDRYSDDVLREARSRAAERFAAINADLITRGKNELEFEYLGRPGLLQDNINELVENDGQVSIVFVGRKMLDFRIQDVKRLHVPFMFME